ncbi:MAG: multicopper oxidase domain-containing protein [Caldilineales bacterium]|nr:multicopper oxidase domain-containing protein [Caldilineales bacterium]MCW5858812.1 multicopper oxidase domain-containing protein [Caldilineales bacterium]
MPFRSNQLNRRSFLRAGALGLLGLAGGVALKANQQGQALAASLPAHPPAQGGGHGQHMFMPGTVGEVDHAANGFNPTDILTDFDYGTVSTLPSGQTLREFLFVAQIKDIEVVPGIVYQAWTYNGRVPGPTIRARQGDRIRINFLNATGHPHTIHFHGIHPGSMDGVFEPVPPGGQFVYEFDAEPFGVHLYHCHIMPLATHISRGLYGAFIVEPPGGWPQADRELVMVLNGFDLDFDMANDVYAVNTIPFHYDRHPIAIKVGELVRIFLVNILEFDPINSFHLHANLFHYYPTGTSLTPSEYTDMIAQMQAQRGMLEFRYKFPGKYMFHAHKTEFAELGWTGNFQVEA